MRNWYCIRTRRYKERWVAQQLISAGYETHLPLLRERRIVRRQAKWVIEPLFPCYMFAYVSAIEGLHGVHYMPGVIDMIGTPDDGPISVDEGIIRALREKCQSGYVEVQPAAFIPADKLEIVDGPFRGLKAVFQRELKAGERVAVLLELLSSQIHATLPTTCVQKI